MRADGADDGPVTPRSVARRERTSRHEPHGHRADETRPPAGRCPPGGVIHVTTEKGFYLRVGPGAWLLPYLATAADTVSTTATDQPATGQRRRPPGPAVRILWQPWEGESLWPARETRPVHGAGGVWARARPRADSGRPSSPHCWRPASAPGSRAPSRPTPPS